MNERLFLTFKVTRDGEDGHPMDHVLKAVYVENGELTAESLAGVAARIQDEVRRKAGGVR